MMDYTQCSVEDLASDERFIQWVTHRDAEAVRFWEDFIERHPEMKVKILQARTLVLNLAKAERRVYSEEQIDKIWQSIDDRIAALPEDKKSRRLQSFILRYAIAAAFAVTVAGFVWLQFLRTVDPDSAKFSPGAITGASDYIEEVNTSGQMLRLHLSDGSVVILENDSRLTYKKQYEGDSVRVVYLTGEAFFEVARNPSQPFLVRTDEVITRVLGTSFRVAAPQGDAKVVVSVKTGKVSVYTIAEEKSKEKTAGNAVILLPNEQVTYQRDVETFGKELVNEPVIVSPSISERDFNFENTPVRDVFDIIEKGYGIDIIFDEELMGNCFFTAPLGSEPLFNKLSIICRAIGARYEVIDARIVITGPGC